MRTSILLLSAWLLSSVADGQQLSAAEYFIDADPGVGAATPFTIASGNTVSTAFSVDASALPVGFHNMNVRFKDAQAHWGLALGRLFYVYELNSGGAQPAPPVAAGEYFIDADPGVGAGIAFSVPPGNTTATSFPVDVSALAVGFHNMNVRLKDSEDHWGLALGRLFYVYELNSGGAQPAPPIAAGEYFIDADPGVGAGLAFSVPPGNTTATSFSVDVSALAVGFHNMNVRLKDSEDHWGLALGRLFYVYDANSTSTQPAPPIAAAEYFIGADPGVGNGTALPVGTPQNSVSLSPVIDVSTLPQGAYTLSTRFLDTQGHWGLAEAHPFVIVPPGTPLNDECIGAEVLPLRAFGACPGLSAVGSTAEATASDATGCGGLEYNDVWYSVNSGSSPTIQLDLSAISASDLRVEVLDGCGGNNIVCLSTFPSSFSTTPNTAYLVRVFAIPTDGSFTICASGAVEDCLGVPGGPNGPGTSCDDGSASTISDLYQGNCSCAGYDCLGVLGGTTGPGSVCDYFTTGDGVYNASCQCIYPVDCEGTEGGSALPGTACDDGNACTVNDTWSVACACAGTIADSDGDGICDAQDDCPSYPGEQGDPCDDLNANTTGDIITALCVCAGTQLVDCEGMAGGPAQPGTACNDGDPCTTDDIYLANCTCAGSFADSDGDGTCDAEDGCPADPLKTTQGICGCGVADTDSDADGMADCIDPCPNGLNPGLACDDDDVCTSNDMIQQSCICSGTFQDTDGDGVCDAQDDCPSYPGEQGDPCDDLNANTTGDIITALCVCAGTQQVDCEGEVGGPAQPGTACDDGVNCTVDDVYSTACVCAGTFADQDGDGICDAIDNCPDLAGVQGDACDDGNANTVGDLITAACVCSGTLPNDACANAISLTLHAAGECPALGVTGTLEGATSSDPTGCGGQPINDVWYMLNSGSATLIQLDLTGDGATGFRVEVMDACGGGTFFCLNSFPSSFAATPNTGYWLRVMNITTEGDFSICVSNTVVDCAGELGGAALPGTACNDNEACTTNDVWDPSCICTGIFQDTDSDGTCDAQDGCPTDPNKTEIGICGCGVAETDTDSDGTPDCVDNCPNLPGQMGDPCDVGNPCTGGGFIDANCVCQSVLLDTDGDGIPNCGDNCPNVAGQQGSPCNDGNANTINDALNNLCQCVGQPVGGCTGNALTLSVKLDGAPQQTTWTLFDESQTTVLAAGGPYLASQANLTIVVNICVANGCYHLRVSDSGSNGITNGGYVLRDAQSRRIIDGLPGAFTGTSEIVANVPANSSFCVPMSNIGILGNGCDRTKAPNTPVGCNSQPGASGYQFWFFDAHGSYSRRVLSTTPSMVPSYLVTSPIPQNLWLNVRARAVVNGVYGSFGPACRYRISSSVASRSTEQEDRVSPRLSLYPNPNRDGRLTVNLQDLAVIDETSAVIEVYDALGQLMLTELAVATEGNLNHVIDQGWYRTDGIYMVVISVGNERYTGRLVKD